MKKQTTVIVDGYQASLLSGGVSTWIHFNPAARACSPA